MSPAGSERASVTAIIPTYNRRAFLGRAIESILAQDPLPGQVLVVDDGSTDGSADMVRQRFGSRVELVVQSNRGNAVARRRGVDEARGEWIAFLDDDDEWTQGRSACLLDAAARVPPDVAWIFGDTSVVTDAGPGATLFQEHGLTLKGELEIFDEPLRVQFPYQFGLFQSSLIRRRALLEADCFSPLLRSSVDILAGFKIACRYRYAAVPFVVTRLSRTTNLRESSVALSGLHSPDYYRARILSFALAAEVDRKGPWRRLHQDAVRGYCLARAREGHAERLQAFAQFRYGASLKAVAFLGASLLGLPGIALWNSARRWF